GQINERVAEDLRWHYQHLRTAAGGQADDGVRSHLSAERAALRAARQALIGARERGEIDNTVLRRLQHTLDVADERVASVTEADDPL
ncbi:MAG TPA: hypothetical protein VKG44_04065, partial [Candidatus Baltobacteraceae bacterium]|nr:hypothetical protein [Candidatus Baltobacteraceae bacterium]